MLSEDPKDYKKLKHTLGFYYIEPLPSSEELSAYYRDKFYQNCTSASYSPDYTPEERARFANLAMVSEKIWQDFTKKSLGSVIDIGCGEGFFLNYFHRKGWKVRGCDFSSFGIKKHNPDVLPFFTQGDIFSALEALIKTGEKYDLINLSNVLEHVIKPLELLDQLKNIMHKKSLLRINVPNDFSEFQEAIVDRGFTGETWFGPPEHLSYFTFSSLKSVVADRGFKLVKMLAGFPIEIFLWNKHSNYWADRGKGKEAHMARVGIDNFLIEQGVEQYIEFYEAAANANLGRDCIAFVALK